jgi:tetratricopeptide (TPR) repeat protein
MDSLPPWLRYLLAQLLVYFKQHERALRAFEHLLAQEPDARPGAWSTAAFLYAEKGRFQDAIHAFERALALQPRDPASLFNLGFALQRVGKHQDAAARFEQAIALRANLDRAWYGLGLSLAHLERHAEAARLQPLNPYARYQLAGAWFKLGEHEKVRAEYRKLKGFDPKIAAQVSRDFGVPPDPD